MKRLLLAPLILGLTAPVQARPDGVKPDLKVGECTSATVQKLRTTWRDEQHDSRAIIFLSHSSTSSPFYLYLGEGLKEYKARGWDYLGTSRPIDIEDARKMYKPNDRIKLCLKFIPVECRKSVPDRRGEIYSITKRRTNKTHYGRYGKNGCGGA